MEYIISETARGNFIVQRPNGYGGLYPLIPDRCDCRNTLDCLKAIHEDLSDQWRNGAYENATITLRLVNDPDNLFTQ